LNVIRTGIKYQPGLGLAKMASLPQCGV
ncbi:hypothetical protein A2U01_0105443, partial [Trifolium medium]|nr:hypothetical protein [Trifolium medium]